jgi:hypothetical protein
MKAPLAKELRLVLPAYVAALLLAVVPVWLFGRDSGDAAVALLPFGIGVVALALSSFGRELALNTFPLMLAEPVERSRIWWTKISVLSGGLATVFVAWMLSCAAWFNSGSRPGIPTSMLVAPATIAAVAFAGGLWTTLLLQQVTAALWFTILVPAAITVIGANTVSDPVLVAVLGVYSLAGFAFAWWRFRRVEEIGWTGGVISLPAWRSRAGIAAETRARRPLAALARKELQLQQVGLFGMAWLFIIHLGVMVLRKVGHFDSTSSLHTALDVFGGIWLLAPFVISAVSTAEERKLGTLDGLLSLPVSCPIQLALKLIFVLILGGLLPGLLWATAERVGLLIGAPADIDLMRQHFSKTVMTLSLPTLGLSLAGFYASTLTRNVIQAMAAGVVVVMALWLGIGWLSIEAPGMGLVPWRGPLLFYIAVPTLVLVLIWLAARNFRVATETSRSWWRNGLALLGAFVFIGTATAITYHRGWELLLPLEPAHRQAQLDAAHPPRLKSYGGSALLALFDKGPLWTDRLAYDPGRLVLSFGERTGFELGGKWENLNNTRLMPGSNWVDAVAGFQETVAIRGDGTLWVSEQPRTNVWNYNRGEPPPREDPAPLARFGSETNWQTVVRGWWDESSSIFLLKQDGTLWHWTWSTNWPRSPGLRFSSPRRLGDESDWDRIMSARGAVYAWKREGFAYVLHPAGLRGLRPSETPLEPEVVIERLPSQDNFHWRSLTDFWPLHVAVREDGTLWAWDVSPPPKASNIELFLAQPPVQITSDTDWQQVAGTWGALAGLKADGSIWQWRVPHQYATRLSTLTTETPTRLGSHNDWLAIGSLFGGIVSLSADGNLWYWWTRDELYWDSSQPMLMASRRPVRIGNILR